MQKVNPIKEKKRAKLTALIFSGLLAISLAFTIINGVNLPHNDSFESPENGRYTSVVAVADNQWLYSDSSGTLTRVDGDDKVLESVNLKEQIQSQLSLTVKEITSIYAKRDSSFLYANSSDGYVFKCAYEGTALTLQKDYVTYSGTLLDAYEGEEYFYLLTRSGKIAQVAKYPKNALSSTPVAVGYLYRCYEAAHAMVNYEALDTSAVIFYSFDEIGENLYFSTRTGFIQMATSFEGSDYGYKIEKRESEIYASTHADKSAAGESDEQIKKEAYAAAAKEMGVSSYDPAYGSFQVAMANYDSTKYNCFNTDAVNLRGVVYKQDEETFYVVCNNTTVSKIALKDFPTDEIFGTFELSVLDGVSLPYLPKSESRALYYDPLTSKAYVLYANESDISLLDLTTKKITASVSGQFGIESLCATNKGERIHFIYYNSEQATSGTGIMMSLDIVKTASAAYYRPLFITFLVISIVCFIGVLLGIFGYFFPKNAVKFFRIRLSFKKNWRIYLLLVPFLVLLFLFCYYPAIGSIRLSFFHYTLAQPMEIWNHFKNYVAVFSSSESLRAIGNTFFFLAFDLIFAFGPPLVFAFFLSIMKSKRYSNLTRTLLFLPAVIPGIASLLIWKTGIYGEFGVLNQIITACGGTAMKFTSSSDLLRWSIVFQGFPFVGSYLIFYGAMMNIPQDYYEAAELEGAGVWRRFFQIDIPLIAPQLKYVFVITFITSVQNFARTYMFDQYNTWGTATVIHQMYSVIATDKNYGLGAAYATVLFLFLFTATFFNLRSQWKNQGGENL